MPTHLFTIDHASQIPLHVQVEGIMRELIDKNEYQKGKLLPNEVDIAKRLGISRNTVRQAINTLVNEQLLVRKKGVGTRVIQNAMTTKLTNWSSFTLEMHQNGVRFTNLAINVEWVHAQEFIANLFGVSSGVDILKLTRIRGLDTGPVVYFESYFHPRIGLTGKEDFSQPLYEMLEKEYNTVVVLSKEEINAILSDNKLARILQMEPGEPLLLRKRIVYDPGGRVVEYNIGYYRADGFTYAIDIAR